MAKATPALQGHTDPVTAAVGVLTSAWAAAKETESVYVYDPDNYQVIRCQMDFDDIRGVFPASCRWMPDYGLLRRVGAAVGAAIGVLLVVFGVLLAVKGSGQAGTWMGIIGVLLAGPLAMVGWMMAPSFPWHDYRPFSILRRVTVQEGDEKPKRALPVSHTNDDGSTRYLVPYMHTNLNLPSLVEVDDARDHHPFVVRAETLFNDAKMEDIQEFITPVAGIKDFIKAYGLLGLIAMESIVLFLMYAMTL